MQLIRESKEIATTSQSAESKRLWGSQTQLVHQHCNLYTWDSVTITGEREEGVLAAREPGGDACGMMLSSIVTGKLHTKKLNHLGA